MNNNLENQNNITQELTYGTVWNYKDKQGLNLAVCLSELIDNSISSFQKWYDLDPYECPKKLKIHLISNCDRDYNRQIIVIDNAYGMTKNELENSIKINKDIEVKTNKGMNQYGIGLKNSIFWLGDDARIITQQNGDCYELYFADKKEDRKSSTIFTCAIDKLDKKFDSNGTKITIFCLKGKNRFWSELNNKNTEKLIEYLGKKYYHYLKGNGNWKLELYISYDTSINQSLCYKDEPILPCEFNKNPLKFSNFFKVSNDYNLYLSTTQKVFDKNFKNKYENNEFFMKLYNKFINDEEIEWEDKIYLDSKKEIEMKINFSLLDDPNKNESGLIISHNNRYIYFPSNSKNGSDKYQDSYKYCDDKKFNGHWRWLVMDMKLEEINGNENCNYIKPDENKVRLIFDESNEDSPYSEDNFKYKISEYFEKNIDGFLEFIIELKNNKKTNIKEQISQSLKNKDSAMSIVDPKIDEEDNSIYWNESTGYCFKVYFTEKDEEEQIIAVCTDLTDENEKTKKFEINMNSKFIKNEDNKSLAICLLHLFIWNKQNNGQILIPHNGNIENMMKKIIRNKNKNEF